MPECQNCGAFVTDAYARVFTPDGVTEPRACPDCPDKVRDNGLVRESRGSRAGGSEPTKYDPEKDPTVDTTGGETATAGGPDE